MDVSTVGTLFTLRNLRNPRHEAERVSVSRLAIAKFRPTHRGKSPVFRTKTRHPLDPRARGSTKPVGVPFATEFCNGESSAPPLAAQPLAECTSFATVSAGRQGRMTGGDRRRAALGW